MVLEHLLEDTKQMFQCLQITFSIVQAFLWHFPHIYR